MTEPRILGSDAARAVGRFRPEGVLGYRAKSGGPLRETRAEAEADERTYLDSGESPVIRSDRHAARSLRDAEDAGWWKSVAGQRRDVDELPDLGEVGDL